MHWDWTNFYSFCVRFFAKKINIYRTLKIRNNYLTIFLVTNSIWMVFKRTVFKINLKNVNWQIRLAFFENTVLYNYYKYNLRIVNNLEGWGPNAFELTPAVIQNITDLISYISLTHFNVAFALATILFKIICYWICEIISIYPQFLFGTGNIKNNFVFIYVPTHATWIITAHTCTINVDIYVAYRVSQLGIWQNIR